MLKVKRKLLRKLIEKVIEIEEIAGKEESGKGDELKVHHVFGHEDLGASNITGKIVSATEGAGRSSINGIEGDSLFH